MTSRAMYYGSKKTKLEPKKNLSPGPDSVIV